MTALLFFAASLVAARGNYGEHPHGVLVPRLSLNPPITLWTGGPRLWRSAGRPGPGPAANIREIFAVTLQLLVCANVPSLVGTEVRKQWRLGPKRGHFGGRLGNGAYVPKARRV